MLNVCFPSGCLILGSHQQWVYSKFSTLSSILIICFSYCSDFCGCKVLSHWVFICISLVANDVDFFMCFAYLYIFHGKMSIQIFVQFLKFVFFIFCLMSCKCSLDNLDTNILWHTWFVNTSSNFVGCLFTFLLVSSTVQEILILMKTNISIYFLCAFGILESILIRLIIISHNGHLDIWK